MKLNHINFPNAAGEKRLAYWSAGSPDSERALVCVHGLMRHSRDFDEIALALSDTHYVVCPDLPGRGLSDWFDDPAEYDPQRYIEVLLPLLQRLQGKQIDWVGTSLGGLLGMALAAQPKSPISRLVINDIGPELPIEALQRIANYVDAPEFDSLAEVELYLRQHYTSFQGLTDSQWARLASYGSRVKPEGGYQLHYDPKISNNTQAAAQAPEAIKLWDLWHAIEQPCLLVHGLESDLLTHEIRQRMQDTRPGMVCLELPGLGHAPPLMTEPEVDAIVSFLRSWDA